MPTPLTDPSGRALEHFYQSLAQTKAGKKKTRVKVFGASHVAGDGFTSVLRHRLQALYGDSGPGFVVPAHPWHNCTHCVIGNNCITSGFDNPNNHCQECVPATSKTAWSNKSSSAACNDSDGCTTGETCNGSGSCNGGADVSCSDGLSCTEDSCSSTGSSTHKCFHLTEPGSCAISGTCYGDQELNPNEVCQWCDPGVSHSNWTNRPEGTPCLPLLEPQTSPTYYYFIPPLPPQGTCQNGTCEPLGGSYCCADKIYGCSDSYPSESSCIWGTCDNCFQR